LAILAGAVRTLSVAFEKLPIMKGSEMIWVAISDLRLLQAKCKIQNMPYLKSAQIVQGEYRHTSFKYDVPNLDKNRTVA